MDNNLTTKSIQFRAEWRINTETFKDKLERFVHSVPIMIIVILGSFESFLQFLGRIAKLFN